mmetsp:Transcript_33630/g.51865  ORF Transcript_33630/g.51865 Transcript_33630/m.51865 type:complete len:111 (+) Transcript_33630:2941-3273(+)
MMQLKPLAAQGMEEPGEQLAGSESHPILRVQNFKKPQLEKLRNPPPKAHRLEPTHHTPGKVSAMGLQSLDPPSSMLNSKKRKRDNAQLAPLNHPPGMEGTGSKLGHHKFR